MKDKQPADLSMASALEEMKMIIYKVAEDAMKAAQVKPEDVSSTSDARRYFKRKECLMLFPCMPCVHGDPRDMVIFVWAD